MNSDDERRVWRHMTQKTLDLQYSPSKWSNRTNTVEEHIRVLREGSLLARSNGYGTVRCGISYSDTSENTTLDIYSPPHPSKKNPIFVYIHGGYWTLLHKDDSAWFADVVRKAGAYFIAVNYDLCPEATLDTIVEQVRLSIAWISSNFSNQRIIICGHSAGAHLCGMILTTDWNRYDVPTDVIDGAFLISGIYDLVPIELSCVNEPLQLDRNGALRNSPIHFINQRPMECKIYIIVGERDSPEFQRQSKEYYDTLLTAKKDVKFLVIPDVDHFEVVENLAKQTYFISRLIINLITLQNQLTEDNNNIITESNQEEETRQIPTIKVSESDNYLSNQPETLS